MATLTDAIIKNAEPEPGRAYKIFDSKTPGLYVYVKPNGKKVWRHRKIVDGKEKLKTLGDYPKMPLSHARAMATGIQGDGGETLFREMGEQWYKFMAVNWSASSLRVNRSRLEQHIYPAIGDRPIAAIRTSEVMELTNKLREAKKYETARRVTQIMDAIFALGCARLDLTFNPASEVARLRFKRPPVQHHTAMTMTEVGMLLNDIEKTWPRNTGNALLFLILCASRTAEVRFADWSEFRNLHVPGEALWTIPAERMKARREHRVPLSAWAVEVLKDQAGDSFPNSGLVFPGQGGKPFSENTLLFALYDKVGKGKATVHGFRAVFDTHANECNQPWDIIEACLAHVEASKVRKAYNRAEYLTQRRELLDWWAGELAKVQGRTKLL